MSAIDDYLQLLNNNPKMDATKSAFNNWLDTTKNTIVNSVPPLNGDTNAMLEWSANATPTTRLAGLAGHILAWHGSPHKFNKFEDRAIGSGEGAQAFGMGHYSGEDANVLDNYYRKRLSEARDNGVLGSFMLDPANKELLDVTRSKVNAGIDSISDRINPAHINARKELDYMNTLKEIFNASRQDKSVPKPNFSSHGMELFHRMQNYVPPPPNEGYLYQLNLKPNKEDLLNFNTGISNHSPKVIDNYTNAMKSLGLEQDASTSLSSNLKGSNVYKNLTKTTGSDANTSKLLNDFGIPGHAFAGQGGHGLDNYVMYNPNDIEIIRRIRAGMDNPRMSFRRYPKNIHSAVNDFNVDPSSINPRTIDSLLEEMSNERLKNLIW